MYDYAVSFVTPFVLRNVISIIKGDSKRLMMEMARYTKLMILCQK